MDSDRQKKQAWLHERKLESGCVRCGYHRCARALHFHHLGSKDHSISQMVKSMSWAKIKAEVEKCEVLCSNCHLEEHCIDNHRRRKYRVVV